MSTKLYLMRHGEVHNPEQILYGRMPGYRLSERGVEQAHAAGRWLADKAAIKALYCSPMERTQQTAKIVAGYQPALSPVIEERIIEVYTPLRGRADGGPGCDGLGFV